MLLEVCKINILTSQKVTSGSYLSYLDRGYLAKFWHKNFIKQMASHNGIHSRGELGFQLQWTGIWLLLAGREIERKLTRKLMCESITGIGTELRMTRILCLFFFYKVTSLNLEIIFKSFWKLSHADSRVWRFRMITNRIFGIRNLSAKVYFCRSSKLKLAKRENISVKL